MIFFACSRQYNTGERFRPSSLFFDCVKSWKGWRHPDPELSAVLLLLIILRFCMVNILSCFLSSRCFTFLLFLSYMSAERHLATDHSKHKSKKQVRRSTATFVFPCHPILSVVPNRSWFPFENVSGETHEKVSYLPVF